MAFLTLTCVQDEDENICRQQRNEVHPTVNTVTVRILKQWTITIYTITITFCALI